MTNLLKEGKHKWVQEIKEYSCGHKVQYSKHGYKYKYAERPIIHVKVNGCCPDCYYIMSWEGV